MVFNVRVLGYDVLDFKFQKYRIKQRKVNIYEYLKSKIIEVYKFYSGFLLELLGRFENLCIRFNLFFNS